MMAVRRIYDGCTGKMIWIDMVEGYMVEGYMEEGYMVDKDSPIIRVCIQWCR